MIDENGREARYWHSQSERVVCTACPRQCSLAWGQHGFCYVRQNIQGRLVSLCYGRPSAVAVDPIEKKPLYHFLPGTTVFSIGTAGCNLGCRFCQNWELSRARLLDQHSIKLPPREIPRLAQQEHADSVAFTYNDPTVFVEYATDSAIACHELGLYTVAVTAGYIGAQARQDFYAHLDAANIDLKFFSDRLYQQLSSVHLQPILETIEWAVKRGVWVELTTLIIPGYNDQEDDLVAQCRWIATHIGPLVPLHLTAFHPAHQMTNVPPTPPSSLHRAREIAYSEGLRYVYTGNIRDTESQSTRCHACGEVLVERDWNGGNRILRNLLRDTNRCPRCQTTIPGVWFKNKSN